MPDNAPAWWCAIAADIEARGLSRYSADWYEAFRDEYLTRHPDADAASKANVRAMAEWARKRSA